MHGTPTSACTYDHVAVPQRYRIPSKCLVDPNRLVSTGVQGPPQHWVFVSSFLPDLGSLLVPQVNILAIGLCLVLDLRVLGGSPRVTILTSVSSTGLGLFDVIGHLPQLLWIRQRFAYSLGFQPCARHSRSSTTCVPAPDRTASLSCGSDLSLPGKA